MGKFDWKDSDLVIPKRKPKKNAAPRSLYIRRDVINAGEITKWAKSQGFKTVMKGLHVTLAYSSSPVDWMLIPDPSQFGLVNDDGRIEVTPGGPRVVEPLGPKGAIVLLFNSAVLQWRHQDLHSVLGLTSDYPKYQPHITITYDPGELDLSTVEPYTGKIVLGPEIFEEIKPFEVKENKKKKAETKPFKAKKNKRKKASVKKQGARK